MEKETAGQNWLPAILRGVSVSLIAYFLLLAFAAYLTVNGRVGEHLADRTALICAMLAVLVGTIACTDGKRADARLLLCCTAAFSTVVLTVGFLTQMELSLRWPARLLRCFDAAEKNERGDGEKRKVLAGEHKNRRSELDETLIKMHKWSTGGGCGCRKVLFPDVVNSEKTRYNILFDLH